MSASLSNPFPGLRPFRTDEIYLFFGREEQIDALLKRLRKTADDGALQLESEVPPA